MLVMKRYGKPCGPSFNYGRRVKVPDASFDCFMNNEFINDTREPQPKIEYDNATMVKELKELYERGGLERKTKKFPLLYDDTGVQKTKTIR